MQSKQKKITKQLNGFLVSIVGSVFITLVLGSALLFAESDVQLSAEYVHRVQPVTVSKVAQYQVLRRFSGRISARQHADIGFEHGGKLAEIFVDEGARVQKGDVVAMLDVELLRIEQQELNAQLKESRARLQLTVNNLQRQKSLKKSGYTSEQRLDELSTERMTLMASIARLDASLELVATRVRKASLLAPFDGVITRRFVDHGSVVAAGMGVVRLQQESGMEAHVGVPVRVLQHLKPGDNLQIHSNGRDYQSTLLTAGADVHPVTRTVNLRLSLPLESELINGDLAYLNLPETVFEEGFWVPTTAVTDGVRGLWVVYVLEAEAGQDDRYRLVARNVTVLYSKQQRLFVTGNLSSGEQIVSAGLLRVVPGQRVRLQMDPSLISPKEGE